MKKGTTSGHENSQIDTTCYSACFPLFVFFALFARSVSGPRERYVSPTARHIILLGVVIIVFPLVSVIYELNRRKARRKKHSGVSTDELLEKKADWDRTTKTG
ncbi:MAG: hypothetical protein MUO27_12185 [Sedimentisphaerales bacterium]|nr:hypothetical protein [Sedimentisphaerales bacterium]